MLRRLSLLGLVLLVATCQTDDPSSPPVPVEAPDPDFDLVDGSTDGNDHFFFLPPLVNNPNATGIFDGDLQPRVEVCEGSADPCTDVLAEFTTTDGTGGATIEVTDRYQVDWKTSDSGVETGQVYRIRVFLGSLVLGWLDIEFAGTGQEAKSVGGGSIGLVGTDRTLPVSFRLEEGVKFEAAQEGCQEGSGGIIDCDVVVVSDPPGSTTELEVEDENGNLAGKVTIPAGAFPGPFVLILEHIEEITNPDIPLDPEDQIPFFLQVEALDENGNPVTFLEDVTLIVCQPPDLEDSFPSFLVPFLTIFKITADGVFSLLETTVGEPECAGFQPPIEGPALGEAGAPAPLLARLRAGLTRLSYLVRAEPLRALHGGLNTKLREFSEFGATVVVPEEVDLFGYGSSFDWSNASEEASGTDPAPFYTTGFFDDEVPACGLTDAFNGTGGEGVWTGGEAEQTIDLTKEFVLPAGVGVDNVSVWVVVDNDVRVTLNGTDITGNVFLNPGDITPGGQPVPIVSGYDENGFLIHDNCPYPDQIRFDAVVDAEYSNPFGQNPAAAELNLGGVNTLVIEVLNRGGAGYADARASYTTGEVEPPA